VTLAVAQRLLQIECHNIFIVERTPLQSMVS
jgi:hypothetical protein